MTTTTIDLTGVIEALERLGDAWRTTNAALRDLIADERRRRWFLENDPALSTFRVSYIAGRMGGPVLLGPPAITVHLPALDIDHRQIAEQICAAINRRGLEQ